MSKKLSLPSTITLIKFKLYSTYYSAVSGLHNKLFLPVSKYFDKNFLYSTVKQITIANYQKALIQNLM